METFVAYPCLCLLFGSFPQHFNCSAYSRYSSLCRWIHCVTKNLPWLSFSIWNSMWRLTCYLSRRVSDFSLSCWCAEVSGLLHKFIVCTRIKFGCVFFLRQVGFCFAYAFYDHLLISVICGLCQVSRWFVFLVFKKEHVVMMVKHLSWLMRNISQLLWRLTCSNYHGRFHANYYASCKCCRNLSPL